MKKQLLFAGLALTALATLSGCDSTVDASRAPPPIPAPTPTPSVANLSLTPCLSQTVAFGRSLQSILVPDQVTVDLSQPAGFPNGRDLDDPVVDLILAAGFLNLTRHSVGLLASLPVNPNTFDQPLRTSFPYYAAPLGSPTLSATNGTNFNFRANPANTYVRVERAGVAAISTAFIFASDRKNAYNDGSPGQDATGAYLLDIAGGYQALTNALNDDLRGLGLTPCAT